jgi:hypothetical protein
LIDERSGPSAVVAHRGAMILALVLRPKPVLGASA